MLATTEGDWEVEIASYDSKSMQVTHEAVFKRDSPEVSFQLEAESTYSIQIQRELRAPVRIYFLPNSVRNSCSPLTPSVHTIFKLLHLLVSNVAYMHVTLLRIARVGLLNNSAGCPVLCFVYACLFHAI